MSVNYNNQIMGRKTFSDLGYSTAFFHTNLSQNIKNGNTNISGDNQAKMKPQLNADVYDNKKKAKQKFIAAGVILAAAGSIATFFGLAAKGKNINKFVNNISDEHLKLWSNIQEGFKYTVSKIKSLWNGSEKIKCDNINDKIKTGKEAMGAKNTPASLDVTTSKQAPKAKPRQENAVQALDDTTAKNRPQTDKKPDISGGEAKPAAQSKPSGSEQTEHPRHSKQKKQPKAPGVNNPKYDAFKQMYEDKFYSNADPKVIEALGDDFEKYMISGGCLDNVTSGIAASNMKKISEEFSCAELKKIANTEDGQLLLRYYLLDFANRDKVKVFDFLHNLAAAKVDGPGKQFMQEKLASLQSKNPLLGLSESVVSAMESLKPETLTALTETTFIETLVCNGPKERILGADRIKKLEKMFTLDEIQKLNSHGGSCYFGRWLSGGKPDDNLVREVKRVTGKDISLK